MAEQNKLDFERSVSTNLPNSHVVEIDHWADENLSDRSKVLGGILRQAYKIIKEAGGFGKAPSEIIRRLRLDPA
jgi:hypothetical protein